MQGNGKPASSASALAACPWQSHQANLTNRPPTMLMKEELNLLHWLTSQYYQGHGAIIDAGCFLGGSTHALATGLAQNPAAAGNARPMHTYDMFSTASGLWYDALSQYGLAPNQSFEGRFRENVGESLLQRVEVHAGDLLAQSWGEAPIEILFLDICKKPELHDHATRMWFPRLIPGRSIVVQQDYGWYRYYWGNIMMEVFRDHFQVLDDVPVASRVYLCTKAITPHEATEKVFARLSADDKLRHMESALASVQKSPFHHQVLTNYAMTAEHIGRTDLVEKTVAELIEIDGSDHAPKGATPTVVLFPHYFTGPDLPLPEALAHPKLQLISQTSVHERLCLYSMVVSLQPKRMLEIGRARGGSTLVFAEALKQVPGSKFVSLDPNCLPRHTISPALVEKLQGQVTFIDGFSPNEVPKACSAAGGKFDLVFIDACHYYENCLADIEGVIPFLNDNGVILFHDAYFLGVSEAIKTALELNPGLSDCGLVSTAANYTLAHEKYRDQPSVFGGIHMLRFTADRQGQTFRVDGPDAAFTQQSRQITRRLKELKASLKETNLGYNNLRKRHKRNGRKTVSARVSRFMNKVLGERARNVAAADP